MEGKTQKKASSVILTLLIGLIVVSFMFGGYESMKGTPDTLAKVGGKKITYSEYQKEFERLSKLFSSFYNQGKPLSSAQIKQLGLKQQALQSLVQQKLRVLLGEEVGVYIGNRELQDTVMNFTQQGPDGKPVKIFYTNNQFDLAKYKSILSQSGMTPGSFESMIKADLEIRKASQLIGDVPVSNTYIKSFAKIKENALKVDAVSFTKKSLSNKVVVTNKEIKEYLKNDQNLKRTQAVFKERKASLDKPAEVQTFHILYGKEAKKDKSIAELRKVLTAKNFKSYANKYTDDPSGKGKGGALGWVRKGQMVKEFEAMTFSMKPGQISKPIKTQFGTHIIYVKAKKEAKEAKFEDHKIEIAKNHLQKNDKARLDKLVAKVTAEIAKAMKQNNTKKLKAISKKYGVALTENASVNRYEGAIGKVYYRSNLVEQIFKATKGKVLVFDKDPIDVKVVKNKGKASVKVNQEQEKGLLSKGLKQKLTSALLKDIESGAKTKVYGNI